MEKNISRTKATPQQTAKLKLTAEVQPPPYYAASEEHLSSLQQCSDTVKSYDLSLFYISLSITCFTSMFNDQIQSNKWWLAVFCTSAVISLLGGIQQRKKIRGKLKSTQTIVRQIKKNRCEIEREKSP